MYSFMYKIVIESCLDAKKNKAILKRQVVSSSTCILPLHMSNYPCSGNRNTSWNSPVEQQGVAPCTNTYPHQNLLWPPTSKDLLKQESPIYIKLYP